MLSAQLREAVTRSGLPVSTVATGAGIPIPCLHRFMTGERTLRLDSAELLAEYFSMRLTRPTLPKASSDAEGDDRGQRRRRRSSID